MHNILQYHNFYNNFFDIIFYIINLTNKIYTHKFLLSNLFLQNLF
jgi:hypothetical protein